MSPNGRRRRNATWREHEREMNEAVKLDSDMGISYSCGRRKVNDSPYKAVETMLGIVRDFAGINEGTGKRWNFADEMDLSRAKSIVKNKQALLI